MIIYHNASVGRIFIVRPSACNLYMVCRSSSLIFNQNHHIIVIQTSIYTVTCVFLLDVLDFFWKIFFQRKVKEHCFNRKKRHCCNSFCMVINFIASPDNKISRKDSNKSRQQCAHDSAPESVYGIQAFSLCHSQLIRETFYYKHRESQHHKTNKCNQEMLRPFCSLSIGRFIITAYRIGLKSKFFSFAFYPLSKRSYTSCNSISAPIISFHQRPKLFYSIFCTLQTFFHISSSIPVYLP